jgi:cytochrome o ubiquinol oxidase subunit 2
VLASALASCHSGVLDPQGPVGAAQRTILINALAIMLAIVVPTILATLGVSWWFRASNTRAQYRPEWAYSGRIELVVWSIPLLVIIFLGGIAWIGSHDLDPAKPLEPKAEPLRVQVVSLDWKWLFIYPEQGIATVNEMAAPVDRPILFKITASSVMNSFFIPALAGQIYAMPGMETKLNAVINAPGDFDGFSANYSGAGFSGMRFRFHGTSEADFQAWVQKAKAGGGELSRAAYLELERPSERDPVRRFGRVAPDLYQAILNRCVDRNKMCMDQMMAIDADGGLGKVGAFNVAPRPWQTVSSIAPRNYVTAMCSVNDPAGVSLPLSIARIREE